MTIFSRVGRVFIGLICLPNIAWAQSCVEADAGFRLCVPVAGCVENGPTFSGIAIGGGEGVFFVTDETGVQCEGVFAWLSPGQGEASGVCIEKDGRKAAFEFSMRAIEPGLTAQQGEIEVRSGKLRLRALTAIGDSADAKVAPPCGAEPVS